MMRARKHGRNRKQISAKISEIDYKHKLRIILLTDHTISVLNFINY